MVEASIGPESGHCTDAKGDCGSRIAVPFFVSFQIIGAFVFLNLVVAVMIESFTVLGAEPDYSVDIVQVAHICPRPTCILPPVPTSSASIGSRSIESTSVDTYQLSPTQLAHPEACKPLRSLQASKKLSPSMLHSSWASTPEPGVARADANDTRRRIHRGSEGSGSP